MRCYSNKIYSIIMEKIFATEDIEILRSDQLDLCLTFRHEYDCWVVSGEESNIKKWNDKHKYKEVSLMYHQFSKKKYDDLNYKYCCFEVPIQEEIQLSGNTF